MTFSKNCILSSQCKKADTLECNRICGAYVAIHGLSGESGRIAAASIPADYRRVTIENSPVRANQPHAYKLLDAYAATFSRQFSGGEERIKSAYLWSESPGTGKTTTACALLNTYLITHFIGMVKQGKNALLRPVYFLDVNEWQTTFNRITLSVGEEAKKKVSDDFQKRMDTAMNTPFVVLDDIGVRGASEAFRSYLHAVINARVTNKLPTVYTSNLPVSELATLFGEQRLADRVRDMCVEILFVGQSKRGKR